jgi:outer membrane immunogenic protein
MHLAQKEFDVAAKILTAAALLVLTGTGALAADFDTPPQEFLWTGCFAGVHAGGAFSYDKIRSSGNFSSPGLIGGGQVGCDYQLASAWVVGIEGRAAWSSLTSKTPGTGINAITGVTFPTQFTVANDFLASTTARVGYAYLGGFLLYGRGGIAWTREKTDTVFTPPLAGFSVDAGATMTQTGWTIGAGLDWALAPHWSVNFEYDYYDFGSHDFSQTDPVHRGTFAADLKDKVQTLTVGVNYHFWVP